MRIIKLSIKFDRILSGRSGRFLTVYNGKGEKINGKVLTTRLFGLRCSMLGLVRLSG
jgi:hypothetical protein